jgi:hypothetical protein
MQAEASTASVDCLPIQCPPGLVKVHQAQSRLVNEAEMGTLLQHGYGLAISGYNSIFSNGLLLTMLPFLFCASPDLCSASPAADSEF